MGLNETLSFSPTAQTRSSVRAVDDRGRLPVAVTVAGSDSGGGAGIEADLRVFARLGVFGACALTAVTVQNTMGVYEIHPIPPHIVRRQLEAIFEDLEVSAVKTGMLFSREIIAEVVAFFEKHRVPLVVDPVFRAGGGESLLREDAKDVLIQELIPLATVVTPNIPEAEGIAGLRIESVDDMTEAAKRIAELGAEVVVVKGGHLPRDEAVDVIYHKGSVQHHSRRRVGYTLHGSGCTFSAAIASLIALGNRPLQAVKRAEKLMDKALEASVPVGKERVPVNSLVW